MINLAGRKDCDQHIRYELTRCGIETLNVPLGKGEVPYTVEGRLGGFKFRRAWYYWVVTGKMPLDRAERLFEHPVGKSDIRAGGHCGCLDPASQSCQFFNGLKVISQEEWDRTASFESMMPILEAEFIVPPNADELPRWVTCYHVDSELGLYLLANAIREL